MAQDYGTLNNRELSQRRITLDPRSVPERFGAWLKHPRNFARFQITMAMLSIVLAVVSLPLTALMVAIQIWFSWQRHEMPMRYPKHVGGIDPSLDEAKPSPTGKGEIIQRKPANGILYLGNQRSIDRAEHLKELWVTDSDARTHALLMGTTGSGKTVTLLSLCFNALAWGSGFFYSDGKADSSLHAAVWSLCRRVYREDDYLVLNFMTGGADPYKKSKSIDKTSNGMNPWYEGSPDFLSQLSSSLLPKASGDGAQWQQKAVNMMDALIRTLCYERAVGNITLSIGVIREYLALPNLVKLYLKGKKGEIPAFAYLPIKAYLETGLPGFKPDMADKPDKWDQTVWDQHGYLTGQYARTLSMLMDTYGYIFKDKYSEVDMMDVLLNRRILVVMIPTLEKSSQEAANLGKLVVSSIRLMMAMNLGHKLEGTYKDIIDTKATKSPAPYIITMDELGYYFAEGIALMFAQARSLGFMMIAAGQDIAAMAKGDNKEEVDSMIANTKIKYTLALEDPDKTLDVFKKVAGQSIAVEVGSFEGSVSNFAATSYRQNLTGSIQRRDRIELQELKALREMEGVLIFKDQVTRARSFTWFHSAKFSSLPFRLNRFLKVDRPKREDLTEKLKPIEQSNARFTTIDRIMRKIREGGRPAYVATVDPVTDALRETYATIETHNPNTIAVERGIAYYMAAVAAMRQHQADEAGRYWDPIDVDPSTLDVDLHQMIDVGDGDVPTPAPAANAESPAQGDQRNPVYHDPPLQEKRGDSFEDLVRQFLAAPEKTATEETATAAVHSDYETDPFIAPAPAVATRSARKVVDFTATELADDVEDDLSIDAFLRSKLGGEAAGSGASSPDSVSEAFPDGGFGAADREEGAAHAVAPVSDTGLIARADTRLPSVVDRMGIGSAAAAPAAPEVVIGFTEATAQTLVKIETALGSENPFESMKSTEAEISMQLRWTKPVEHVNDMSDQDLDSAFSSIEAVINQSASKVK
jgi:intracellular multiplication protein IcmO